MAGETFHKRDILMVINVHRWEVELKCCWHLTEEPKRFDIWFAAGRFLAKRQSQKGWLAPVTSARSTSQKLCNHRTWTCRSIQSWVWICWRWLWRCHGWTSEIPRHSSRRKIVSRLRGGREQQSQFQLKCESDDGMHWFSNLEKQDASRIRICKHLLINLVFAREPPPTPFGISLPIHSCRLAV